MTDCRTDQATLPPEASDRVDRLRAHLLVARLLLALAAVYLGFFLLKWSSAVKREAVITPLGQQVPDDWKVVIPDYGGAGRVNHASPEVPKSLKPWRFGTMRDHPVQVALCIALVVILAAAFAVCTWRASRLKHLTNPIPK